MGTATVEAKLLQQLTAMRKSVLLEFLLDLQKAYDALDRDRCLGILKAYGFGLRTIQLLSIYWGRLTMVTLADGYFGVTFKGYRGATQGNTLHPTIFNVLVNAVILYWVALVATNKDGMEGLRLSIQVLEAYFYSKDGFVASTQLESLQREFDVLVGLFDWVELRTNKRKTVGISCQPY